jgi:ethanolamine utilization protein EutQ (cupin superfamily)
MKNEVQGKATIEVYYKTTMSVEEFLQKFHKDNIIDQKQIVTLSDGSVHTFQVCDMTDAFITSFLVDDEEIVEDVIEMNKVIDIEEKVTKLDSVTKIAL